jgi:Flp pilus assembly protein TadD
MSTELALAVLQEAETYLVANDLDRAALCFQKAYQLDPKNPSSALGIARIAILLKDTLKARALLEETLSRFPKSAEAMNYLGVVEETSQSYARAMNWYTKAVQTDDACAVAQFNYGRLLAQNGRHEDAFTALQKAAQLAPESYSVRYALGTAAFNAGRFAEAVQSFAECVRLSPNNLDAYATLADALAQAKQPQLAKQTLEVACERLPKEAILYSKRAALEIRAGDAAAALPHSKKAFELEPKAMEYALQLAVAHSMVGEFGPAAAVLAKAVALNPNDWRPHFHLGALLEGTNELEAAKLYYRTAIALDDGAWKPKNNLATILMDEGKPESTKEAVALLERAVAQAPQHEAVAVYYNLALGHFNLGDAAKSKRAALQAATEGPEAHESTFLAKKFLEKMLS